MTEQSSAGQTAAEAYLTALHACGIRHVLANGGTDFAPIVESILRLQSAGRAIPHFVTVPHENVAIAMAQGYAKTCGMPAAVMVHVNVGTANTICGLMNAARDNVPLLLAAGRTPLTESGAAGSRDVAIHWAQENFDQAAMVREHVKWDYELRAGQPVATLVARALDIAMSEPKGPVYLSLPREVLGAGLAEPGPPPRPRPLGAACAVPSAAVDRGGGGTDRGRGNAADHRRQVRPHCRRFRGLGRTRPGLRPAGRLRPRAEHRLRPSDEISDSSPLPCSAAPT